MATPGLTEDLAPGSLLLPISPLGSRAGGLRPEEAAQLASWAAKITSKGTVCFPPRMPKLVTTCRCGCLGNSCYFHAGSG